MLGRRDTIVEGFVGNHPLSIPPTPHPKVPAVGERNTGVEAVRWLLCAGRGRDKDIEREGSKVGRGGRGGKEGRGEGREGRKPVTYNWRSLCRE